MDEVLGALLLILEIGLLWYASPACVGSKRRMLGYASLTVMLPIVSWPWIARQGTKARLARMDNED